MTKRKTRHNTKAFCYWCERTLEPSWKETNVSFTKDHVVPQDAGGQKWVPCCRACNSMKGNMMPAQWREFTETHPQWWKHYPTTAATIIRHETLGR